MSESTVKILVVEDDKHMGMLLAENLESSGFEVTHVEDGAAALAAYRDNDYDLCLLDIMIPKIDGMQVARDIRKGNPQQAFIFITARNMTVDKIEGFDLGADDYITKPFDLDELMMRVRAVLNRTVGPIHNKIEKMKFGGFEVNITERILTYKKNSTKLSAKEAQLIWLLVINSNEPVSRSDILKHVWGSDNFFSSKSMDVYLTKVRKHLKVDPTVAITNIHGFGYKLEVPEEVVSK